MNDQDSSSSQSDENTKKATDLPGDAHAAHGADRPPTQAEEDAAELAGETLDPSVGEHFKEMAEVGAHVKGEGEVKPG